MFKLLGKLPRNVAIAYSGGVDSAVVLDFLIKNHNITFLHFNHGETDVSSYESEEMAHKCCEEYNIKNYHFGKPNRIKYKNESLEEYWRNMRYEWLETIDHQFIVLGHHLDDAIEWWIFSSMHGEGKIIPYQRSKNMFRPFLLNSKKEFLKWSVNKNVNYVHDKSNDDNTRTRNYIRNVMMPHCIKVNPGISKVIKKKIIESSV